MANNPISEFLKLFRKRIEKETGENIAHQGIDAKHEAVSYTHLTLPTNREV